MDWSPEECNATIEVYFEMLTKELSGIAVNKSEYRRNLAGQLNHRSDSAIERKHQNISSILIERNVPYISGYKPLSNYQALLAQRVVEFLPTADTLREAILSDLSQPVSWTRTTTSVLAALVPPPKRGKPPAAVSEPSPREPSSRRARFVDYLAMEAANRDLGLAGEKFVLEFEKARLEAAGLSRLAQDVEHISHTRGDGAGFDILSFAEDGRERLIEVKTTRYGVYTPFFATRNEVEVSCEEAHRYSLYRVHEFRSDPRLFQLAGALTESCALRPNSYLARVN